MTKCRHDWIARPANDRIRFHTGYQPRETDRHDVKLLCERFNIPLPAEYL